MNAILNEMEDEEDDCLEPPKKRTKTDQEDKENKSRGKLKPKPKQNTKKGKQKKQKREKQSKEEIIIVGATDERDGGQKEDGKYYIII